MKKKILFVFVPLAFLTLAACAPSTAPSKSASVSSVASLSSNAASAGTSSQNTGALALSSVASKYNYEKVAKGFGEVTLPSSGAQKILVLPIGFTDYAWSSTYSADLEKTLFGMARETGWQSLQSFYATSSHGALSITGKVAEVYKCGLSTSQVINKNDANQTEVDALINAAVASYKNTHTDAKDFDQNGDGYLDGVMAIYAPPTRSSMPITIVTAPSGLLPPTSTTTPPRLLRRWPISTSGLPMTSCTRAMARAKSMPTPSSTNRATCSASMTIIPMIRRAICRRGRST